MGNAGKEVEILWKNQKEMLRIKKKCKTEIKNAFNEFSRLDTREERISELEDFSIGFFQNWKANRKNSEKKKKGQNIQELWYNYQRYNLVIMGKSEEKRERNRRNIWNNNDWEFPQINVRHQTTDPESTRNTKKDKHKQTNNPLNFTQAYYFQIQKVKHKEKS